MRVKICGITNAADAVMAAEAGADAIGLNFVGGPRHITPAVARDILRALPPMVTPVALVRADAAALPRELTELFSEFRLSHLQLYGQLDGADSSSTKALEPFPQPVLAALIAAGFRPMPVWAVKDAGFAAKLAEWASWLRGCRPNAVVLDAYDPNREGGTGRAFRWEWVHAARGGGAAVWPPILLAGGLTPENVAEAVRIVRPYGVDVSSGVERADAPGRKDPDMTIAFIRNARAAMQTL